MSKYYLFLFSTMAMSSLFSASINRVELEKALKYEKKVAKEFFVASKDCERAIKERRQEVDILIDVGMAKLCKTIHNAAIDIENTRQAQIEKKTLINNIKTITEKNNLLFQTYKQNLTALKEKCENLIQSAFFSVAEAKKLTRLKNLADTMEHMLRRPRTDKFQNINLTDKYQLITNTNENFEKNIQELTSFNQALDEKINERQKEEAENQKSAWLTKIRDSIASTTSYAYENLSSAQSNAYNAASQVYNMLPELPSKEIVYEVMTQRLPTLPVLSFQKSSPIAIPTKEEVDHIFSRSGGNENTENDFVEVFTMPLASTPINESTITEENTELTISSFDPEEEKN